MASENLCVNVHKSLFFNPCQSVFSQFFVVANITLDFT